MGFGLKNILVLGFVALKPRPRRAYVLTQQAVNILKYLTVLRCSVMCEAVTVGTARRHQIVDARKRNYSSSPLCFSTGDSTYPSSC